MAPSRKRTKKPDCAGSKAASKATTAAKKKKQPATAKKPGVTPKAPVVMKKAPKRVRIMIMAKPPAAAAPAATSKKPATKKSAARKPAAKKPAPSPAAKATAKPKAAKPKKSAASSAKQTLATVTHYTCKPTPAEALEVLKEREIMSYTPEAVKHYTVDAAGVQSDLQEALGTGDHTVSVVYDVAKLKTTKVSVDGKPASPNVKDLCDMYAMRVYLRDLVVMVANSK